jgi:hypothetical protein
LTGCFLNVKGCAGSVHAEPAARRGTHRTGADDDVDRTEMK